MAEYNFNQAKNYLDSISLYVDDSYDFSDIGMYYLLLGDYFNHVLDEVAAHRNYYKALGYMEYSDPKRLRPYLYHNLAFSYIEKNDTENLRVIVDKMEKLNLVEEQTVYSFLTIKARYFNCIYLKNNEQVAALDSAILYDALAAETLLSAENNQEHREETTYNYLCLANNVLKRDRQAIKQAESYLNRAREVYNPQDTSMIINEGWIEGEIAWLKGEVDKAKELSLRQLALMKAWQGKEDLSMYVDLYQRLFLIAMKEQDHATALLYEQKKDESLTRVHDREKYWAIQELQIKYEIDKKDLEITQLKALNLFRKRINLLYLGIALLVAVSSIFVIRLLRAKRREVASKLKIVELEKSEIALQSQLQAEKLRQVELEKYEALLGNHFQEVRLSGMDSHLESLEKDRRQLLDRIDEYSQRLRQYERDTQRKPGGVVTQALPAEAIQTTERLIAKNLAQAPKKEEYLAELSFLDDGFFERLSSRYEDPLSLVNIQYCICFVAGMSTEDIALCLSVEPRSVHMAKHRLRKKAKPEIEIDFVVFLRQLVS